MCNARGSRATASGQEPAVYSGSPCPMHAHAGAPPTRLAAARRHVGEALAAGPAKGPLGTQPTVSIPRDVRVVQLLAAVAKLHQLLVGGAGCSVHGFARESPYSKAQCWHPASTRAWARGSMPGLEVIRAEHKPR